MRDTTTQQGAWAGEKGVTYAIWAPRAKQAAVHVVRPDGQEIRRVALQRDEIGFFRAIDAAGRVGDLYRVSVDHSEALPPPAARFQPHGVHGPASVVEPTAFPWTDHGWRRPVFRDLVIYELHIGTFTSEGTYRAAISKLEFLRELGINAIELMPLADFPGERGWGYDGVQPYAPARAYGTPDDLRALVDAAHAAGIAVILDVVYNHLGPDGNFLARFSPHYFAAEDRTPWGSAINYGHDQSRAVREFFRGNIEYWMEEFHLDGFRLDATHAIIDHSDRHILAEFADTVHARGGYIIAEDERNEARLIRKREEGGFGFDAVWADDFHHIVEVGIVEGSIYRRDFAGKLAEMCEALEHGWYYRGQLQQRKGRPRGTETRGIPPERFIFCISNHDQVGNRALGQRLNQLVNPATYRAASALLLLVPYTPLLFMGQEWAASTPFQYFTDHHGELGRQVEEGRRREFKDAFANLSDVPSPQDPATFQRSKLRWEETGEAEHAAVLALYRELLRLRREYPEFRPKTREGWRAGEIAGGVLALRIDGAERCWLVLCDLRGDHRGKLGESICQPPVGQRWRLAFSSNESRFGGEPTSSWEARGSFHFAGPELLLLQSDTSTA